MYNLYPLIAAIVANPIPVLPPVASNKCVFFDIKFLRSAEIIM